MSRDLHVHAFDLEDKKFHYLCEFSVLTLPQGLRNNDGSSRGNKSQQTW